MARGPHSGVLVGQAHQKFDPSGALTDERTRKVLRDFLSEFEAWAARQAILMKR